MAGRIGQSGGWGGGRRGKGFVDVEVFGLRGEGMVGRRAFFLIIKTERRNVIHVWFKSDAQIDTNLLNSISRQCNI